MTQTPILETRFAPAERASQEVVEQQNHVFAHLPRLIEFVNAFPEVFLVVNRQRQIVFANQSLLAALGEDDEAIRGLRPGEALRCSHADEMPGGCGTSEACRTCGALKAVLASLQGEQAVNECRIVRQDGVALDFRVWGTPLYLNNERYGMIALKDISDEKRRQALERIFFHDILNVAGVLLGYAQMLEQAADAEEAARFRETICRASARLIEEVEMQRAISAAESGDLAVQWGTVDALDLLQELRAFYEGHEVAHDRRLVIDPQARGANLISDRRLLNRVLGNMIKNALEACLPGQAVTLSCQQAGEQVCFEVHNPMCMPREVELQMFQRSFSTKGAGRGLGTYSMKLLSERYLGGAVTFTTSPEHGTTFRVTCPLQPDLPPSNGSGASLPHGYAPAEKVEQAV